MNNHSLPLPSCTWHRHRHYGVLAGILASTALVFVAGWSAWWLCLSFMLLLLLIDGVWRASSRLFYPVIRHVRTEQPLVALTFDDGPDPAVTPQVLDLLAQHGAKATFFVIGRKLAQHPELARRIVAEGHLLANHSWQHARTQNFWNARRLYQDMARCTAAIQRFQTNMPLLYRPPMGLKSAPLATAACRHDLPIIAWSVHTHDSRMEDAQAIARRACARSRAGDIILMHDGHDLAHKSRPHCVPALERTLQGLKQHGLRSVTLADLLAAARRP